MTWHIYVLLDPRTEDIRYVGVSKNPKMRLCTHISEAKRVPERNHRTRWIYSLLRAGMEPTLVTVESCFEDWAELEKSWIAAFRGLGHKLLNGTDGGEGTPGHTVSPETRAKLSAATIGRKKPPEAVAKMAAALRGHPGHKQSPESRQKISEARKGIKFSPETLAKMSAAKMGKKASPETRAKIAKASRGFRHSEESKARMSESKKAMVLSGHRMYATKLDQSRAYRQRRREKT